MKNIKIDYISNTIIVTKGFYESAQNYGTEEQVTMRELQKEFPEMKISIRKLAFSCQGNRARTCLEILFPTCYHKSDKDEAASLSEGFIGRF